MILLAAEGDRRTTGRGRGRGRGPLPPSVRSASARTARSRTPASASFSGAGDRLDRAAVAELAERTDRARADLDVAVAHQRDQRLDRADVAELAERGGGAGPHPRVAVLQHRDAGRAPPPDRQSAPARTPRCCRTSGRLSFSSSISAGHRAAAAALSECRRRLTTDAGVGVLEGADQRVGRGFRRALLRGDRAARAGAACRATGAA